MLSGFIIMALPVIAVISLCFILVYASFVKRSRGKQSFLFYLARYAFFGCCLSLLYLTILWYYPDITFCPEYHSLNIVPFVWTKQVYAMGEAKMLQQVILNVAMFVPYGLLLPMAVKSARKWWANLLTVLLTTVTIETLQYFMGRSCDIDDVITNFAGGVLGYFLFLLLKAIFGKKQWFNKMLNAVDVK